MTKLSLQIQLKNYRKLTTPPTTPLTTISEAELNFEDTAIANFSATQTFLVNGTNLVSPMTITASEGFIVNIDGGTIDQSPISIDPVAGEIEQLIYVRFAPTEIEEYTGTIVVSAGGATDKTVTLSGIAIATPYEYFLRTIIPDGLVSPPFPKADGCVSCWHNGWLYKSLGWNGSGAYAPFHASAGWARSEDNGRTWEAIADSPVHSHGGKAHSKDGFLWYCGVNEDEGSNNIGTFLVKYNDETDTWTTVTLDVGLDPTLVALFMSVQGHFYKIGGQNSINILFPVADSTIYRINDDGTTTLIGETPEAFMTASTGYVIGNDVYIGWGGELSSLPNAYNNLVTKIYKTSDLFQTFTVFADIPEEHQGIWLDAEVFDNRVWLMHGVKEGANQVGLFCSTNSGTTWTTFSTAIPARHLTSLAVAEGSLYILSGNDKADAYRVEKVTFPDIEPDIDFKFWFREIWPENRPGNDHSILIDAFIKGCKDDDSLSVGQSNWDLIDLIHLTAGMDNEEQALLPIKTTNTGFFRRFQKVASPTVDATGISGSGVGIGSGFTSQYAPEIHGISYSKDDAFIMMYSLSSITEDTQDFGAAKAFLSARQANGRFYGAINDATQSNELIPNGKGYRAASRLDDESVDLVYGSTHLSKSAPSTLIEGAVLGICGVSIAGNFYSSAKKLGSVGAGGGQIDHDKLRTRIESYFTSAGVSF